MASMQRTPMTGAQRQRRHRDKRRAELQVLRAVVPQSAHERDLQAQVQHLQWKLQTTARDLATAQVRSAQLEAAQTSVQAWQEALKTLLPKLSPAPAHVVRQHLQACGLHLATNASAANTPARVATPTTAQLYF